MMASAAVLRPHAAPTFSCCTAPDVNASDCAPVRSSCSSKCSVKFLVNLPWGGTAVTSFPLLELPFLTAYQIRHQRHHLKTSLSRIPASAGVSASAVGLYLSGSFLISLAAARAGLGDAFASELRVVLQQQEVRANSFVPLEKVVGIAAAVAVAKARDLSVAVAGAGANASSEGAPLCSLWLLLRLRGGKGGFGALLKKQKRKKRANFTIDACRDLTGRRIRQAEVVTRIKAWMEKKRKEEALVGVLAQDMQEKPPEAKPAVALDAAYISQQISQVTQMPDLVARGLKQQLANRKQQEFEQRARSSAPQNRTLYAQLRDAVELDSDEDQWSDMEADEDPTSNAQAPSVEKFGSSSSSSSSSGSSGSSSRSWPMSASTEASRHAVAAAGSSNSSSSSSSSSTSTSSEKTASPGGNAEAGTQALMQQLEQMRLKAAAAEAAKRERKAAEEAAAAKAAAEAAEKVAREAKQLDVSRFGTVEELVKAVDEAVVKEKLKQLGWKCGGRPEERAARLLQLKTVDLANVPKALLARPPARKA